MDIIEEIYLISESTTDKNTQLQLLDIISRFTHNRGPNLQTLSFRKKEIEILKLNAISEYLKVSGDQSSVLRDRANDIIIAF